MFRALPWRGRVDSLPRSPQATINGRTTFVSPKHPGGSVVELLASRTRFLAPTRAATQRAPVCSGDDSPTDSWASAASVLLPAIEEGGEEPVEGSVPDGASEKLSPESLASEDLNQLLHQLDAEAVDGTAQATQLPCTPSAHADEGSEPSWFTARPQSTLSVQATGDQATTARVISWLSDDLPVRQLDFTSEPITDEAVSPAASVSTPATLAAAPYPGQLLPTLQVSGGAMPPSAQVPSPFRVRWEPELIRAPGDPCLPSESPAAASPSSAASSVRSASLIRLLHQLDLEAGGSESPPRRHPSEPMRTILSGDTLVSHISETDSEEATGGWLPRRSGIGACRKPVEGDVVGKWSLDDRASSGQVVVSSPAEVSARTPTAHQGGKAFGASPGRGRGPALQVGVSPGEDSPELAWTTGRRLARRVILDEDDDAQISPQPRRFMFNEDNAHTSRQQAGESPASPGDSLGSQGTGRESVGRLGERDDASGTDNSSSGSSLRIPTTAKRRQPRCLVSESDDDASPGLPSRVLTSARKPHFCLANPSDDTGVQVSPRPGTTSHRPPQAGPSGGRDRSNSLVLLSRSPQARAPGQGRGQARGHSSAPSDCGSSSAGSSHPAGAPGVVGGPTRDAYEFPADDMEEGGRVGGGTGQTGPQREEAAGRKPLPQAGAVLEAPGVLDALWAALPCIPTTLEGSRGQERPADDIIVLSDSDEGDGGAACEDDEDDLDDDGLFIMDDRENLFCPFVTPRPTGGRPPLTPLPDPVTPRPRAPPAPTPIRGVAVTPATVAAFKRQREALTQSLYKQFNEKVFEGKLPEELRIVWNPRLKTTAGLTYHSRESNLTASPTSRQQGNKKRTIWVTQPQKYTAHVELSSKVVDAAHKLESTLLHELCHVAAWLLDHTSKPPHGPAFKRWAARARVAFPHIPVTRCHNYAVHVPYEWRCNNPECGEVFKRHSRSINLARMRCGRCRSTLTFLGKFNVDGTPAKTRTPSAFSLYVRDNFAAARAVAGPGTPHAAVMKSLAQQWRADKAAQDLTS